MNGTSLPAIFPLPFRFLECFSIRYKNYRIESSDWNYFSSETKDALSNIILSSTGTLKSLSLSGLPMCRLPSSYTFPTLRHWSWTPSRRTIFGTRTQVRWHEQLRRKWLFTQWLIDVCSVSGMKMYASRRFPSSSYFSIIRMSPRTTDLIFLPCHLHFLISLDLTSELGMSLISCLSWWVHFSSASHLLNTWSSTLRLVMAVTTSSVFHFMRIYVKPGVLGTSWPLIQPLHGYKELTLTLLSCMADYLVIQEEWQAGCLVKQNSTRMKSQKLSCWFTRMV